MILNVNKSKNYIINGKIGFSLKLIKFLKYLSTETSTIIIIGILYILVISFCIFMASIFKFECTTTAYIGISGPLYILTVPILFIFFLLVFDVFMHFKKIKKCKFKEIFIKKDPMRYRAEQIFGVLSLIFLFPTLIYLFITLPILTIKDDHKLFGFSFFGIALQPYLMSLSFYSLYFYLYGFITIFTIVRQFRERFQARKKPELDELTKIFLDPSLKELFCDHCKVEWSLENFAIFNDIELFKKEPSLEKSIEIFKKYLDGINSECEVNVPESTCRDIKAKIQHNHYSEKMFENVQRYVELNLTDTYSRFIFTEPYLNYVKNETFLEENQ